MWYALDHVPCHSIMSQARREPSVVVSYEYGTSFMNIDVLCCAAVLCCDKSIVLDCTVHYTLNSLHIDCTRLYSTLHVELLAYRIYHILEYTNKYRAYSCRWMPFEDVIEESTHPLIRKICSTLYCGPDGAALPLGSGPARHMREDAVQWPGREPYPTYFAA